MAATVTRNWEQIAAHLAALDARDVPCHESGKAVSRRLAFVSNLARYLPAAEVHFILDVGCAGITRSWWLEQGYTWAGLTFPRDAAKLAALGIMVDIGDVACMPYAEHAFDLVYASHVLEHSAMPLVALRECRRVGRVLAMAVPKWPRLLEEKYHFCVVPAAVWGHWFDLTGWRIAANLTGARDYQFICTQNDTDFVAINTIFRQFVAERAARKRARAHVRHARGGPA